MLLLLVLPVADALTPHGLQKLFAAAPGWLVLLSVALAEMLPGQSPAGARIGAGQGARGVVMALTPSDWGS